MNLNTENIKKGPLTTITGLVLIASGIASVFINDVGASWSEALVVIAAGLALLFVSDKDKKDPPVSGTGAAVGMLVFMLLLSSCSTIRVPGNEDRASRVVAKNLRQNEAIFNAFPGIKTVQNVGVTLPEIVLQTPTEYITRPDANNLARITELELLLREKGDTVIIEKWRSYIEQKPSEYLDSTYVFDTEFYTSLVILKDGKITNPVTLKERDVQAPQAIIQEVKKTSAFDWILRILIFGGLIVVVLLFVRRRGGF